MHKYLARRFILLVPTVFFVTIIVFMLARFIPGDAAEMMLTENAQYSAIPPKEAFDKLREDLGLNRPIYTQYFVWIGDVLTGSWGTSLWTKRSVISEIKQRFPITLELALMTLAILTVWGLTVGIISAIRQDSFLDYSLRSLAILGLSVPYFWSSLMLIIFAGIWFKWGPSPVYIPFAENPLENLKQFVLPSVMMGVYLGSSVARMTRATVLEVMRQDYIRTARAKGLRERVVIYRHALRNALIPVVTVMGLQFSFAIGGSTVLETVWALPGVGQYMVTFVIAKRDYPMLQGLVLFLALIVVMINLLVDISYAWLNPRIRYA